MGQCTHHACNWTVVLHFAMLTVFVFVLFFFFFLGGGELSQIFVIVLINW